MSEGEKVQKEFVFSVGMRVLIRGAEWFIYRVEAARTGGQVLYVRGVTSPVQGREQIFWTEAEKDRAGQMMIREIRPENVKLELDATEHALTTRLRIEAVARRNFVTGRAITYAQHAAMDVLNYQLQPAYHALNSMRDPRARILIADAVGLGKTLEAGVLLTELICRGFGRRILVVTLKSMMAQFQKEMWCRFSIPLVRLDSTGLQRIRSDIPSNHNPFNFYDRTIISIDTLKQDNSFRTALESARWDIIIIDEAHNVAARGHGRRAARAKLAEKLAARCDHLILLSATPHDGSKESFASLMTLLDPLAIADPSNYGPEDVAGLYERRFKKDVAGEISAHFPERELVDLEVSASLLERGLYEALRGLKLEMDGGKRAGDIMFKTTLVKALLSSPRAFAETVEHRLQNPKTTPADRAVLEPLLVQARALGAEDFSKYQKLLAYLKDPKTGWKKAANDRLVIFTERIETKAFLVEALKKDLKLKANEIQSLDGRMRDVEIMQIVEEFGLGSSPLRVLVASDVASEGLNLHYCAHRLIHFDIPWSLITFQQRNGRIDRYGQNEKPIITFLLSSVDGQQDDLNVLRHVVNREINAHDNIGDPGQLMGVYNAEEEENIVARAYQAVQDGEEVLKALDEQIAAVQKKEEEEAKAREAEGDFDFMDLFSGKTTVFDEKGSDTASSTQVEKAKAATIFEDEAEYLSAGLRFMNDTATRKFGNLTRNERTGLWSLGLTDALSGYCRHVLPYELRRRIHAEGELYFTTDPKRMQEETKNARNQGGVSDEEDEGFSMREVWPDVSYLWPLHPVSQWITANVDASFGSQSAPIVRVQECEAPIFLIYAQAPNTHGEPLVQGWYAVTMTKVPRVEAGTFDELIRPYGLDRENFANTTKKGDELSEKVLARLEGMRLGAIQAVRPKLDEAVGRFNKEEEARNRAFAEKLDKRRNKVKQMEFDLFKGYTQEVQRLRLSAHERQQKNIEEAYENFTNWVETHRRAIGQRSAQIVAVLIGQEEV